MFSILLVEDDLSACTEISNCIDNFDDMTLVGIIDNSTDAISYVQNNLPDAVILDLELHHGGGNGLSFLSSLRQLNLKKSPYILVTTNNCSTITYEAAHKLGADFIMGKYQAGYSAQEVVNFLHTICELICSKSLNAPAVTKVQKSPEEKEQTIKKRIQQELNFVGISPKVVGFQYLTDAIFFTMNSPQKHLIRLLGDKYSKSDTSIERAMQNAINRAWRTSDIDNLLTHYIARISSEKGVPTLMEFIFYYANKIKTDI